MSRLTEVLRPRGLPRCCGPDSYPRCCDLEYFQAYQPSIRSGLESGGFGMELRVEYKSQYW